MISRATLDAIAHHPDVLEALCEATGLTVTSGKALCAWHDERTPSMSVSERGAYCFGCGEKGSLFTLTQRLLHISFPEAVRLLGDALGIAVTDGDNGGIPRHRLFAANMAARDFYVARLHDDDAVVARDVLAGRGFHSPDRGVSVTDACAVEPWWCGYAPDSWDALTRYLRGRGFTDDELLAANLAVTTKTGGIVDRFRNRLMWPILDARGNVLGFGGRRLDESDGAKYINTADTPVYSKSSALYGAHTAADVIAATGEVVIVEGYTDVMAAWISGVRNVVASSGTAWGAKHYTALARLLGGKNPTRIVFALDADDAGQGGILRALQHAPNEWLTRIHAVTLTHKDACEVWQADGASALRAALTADTTPIVRHCLTRALAAHDVTTPEGRVDAHAAGNAVLNEVSSPVLRAQYATWLTEQTGAPVRTAVSPSPKKTAAGGVLDVGALDAAGRLEWQALIHRAQGRIGVDPGHLTHEVVRAAAEAQAGNVWDAALAATAETEPREVEEAIYIAHLRRVMKDAAARAATDPAALIEYAEAAEQVRFLTS